MNAYIHAIKRQAALILAVCLALCGQVYAAVLPDGIDTIEDGAFQGDSSLTEISIPETVATIGSEAFADCENLREINIYNPSTALAANALGRKGETRLIRGKYNSTAKTFASQYGFDFRYLPEEVMRVLYWMADKIVAGTTYSQYDCIGFARAAYKNALGVYIASSCPAMYSFADGLHLSKSQIKQLKPGDVVCFTDDKYWDDPGFSFDNPAFCKHVGVYVGGLTMNIKNKDGVYEEITFDEGTFFESSQGAGKTRVNVILLDNSRNYYNRNFMGAVRILY